MAKQYKISPVPMGIIGMGYTGRQHYETSKNLEEIEVLAVSDVRELTQFAGEGPELHRDWGTLLEDDRIQAISICLPHHLHEEVSLACLRADKHVLLEKPLGRNLDEARTIMQAVEESDSVLMVEMTHRFYPPVIRAREIVRSGMLGKIVAIEDRVMDCFDLKQANSWLTRQEFAGGGAALTNGIHLLDRTSWVIGQSLVLESGSIGYSQSLGDIEDTAMMLLSSKDRIPVALLTSFMVRETFNPDDEMTIYGTEGTLRVWAWKGYGIEWKDGRKEEYSSYPGQMGFGERVRLAMGNALLAFAKKIRGEDVSIPSAGEVFCSQQIIDELYRQCSK